MRSKSHHDTHFQHMLTETARVIRREGSRVELELQRNSACGDCELSQGCGTGALGRLLGRRSRPLVIETDQDCRAGDLVVLAIPESALVSASLLLYGLPLAGLLLGGLGAMSFALAEWLVVAAAGCGLFAGFKVAALITQRIELRGQAPHISEINVNPGP
jgi:sigma-E factor negative regulatory protein RseC